MRRSPLHRRNPTRVQRIWCVKTSAIDIPREYRRYAVPGFGREPRVIWTRQRKIAQQISNADEQAGGQAYPMPFQFWGCPLCGRCFIGLMAQEHRQREGLVSLAQSEALRILWRLLWQYQDLCCIESGIGRCARI